MSTAPPPDATLRGEKLVKRFGRRTVVQGVDLEVAPGEIVGLLGPNGAGKTTTFHLIVGLIRASSGQVSLGEHDLTRLPMHRRARLGLGYLPQEPSIFRGMSARDNLRATAEVLPIPRRERGPRVEALLHELGLETVAPQRAYTLSGGERRRLEIARALLAEPRFLLLDEPFSGVDPISVAEVQRIVRSLKERGLGVLITDHSVRETLQIVDRAYLLHDGQILVAGTSQEILNNPDSRRFYLGAEFAL